MNKKPYRGFDYYWKRYGIFATLLITLAVFAILSPLSLTPNNLLTVLSRSAIIGISACGMTFAICSGGFDLSVGAILGLSTCVFAANLPLFGLLPATLLTLLVGGLAGMLNGLAITKLKIQTFVATLAMGMIIKGVALLYTHGSKQMLSRTENAEAKIFSQNVNIGSLQVQLAPLLMMALVFICGYLIYRYTRHGVYTRSIGSNENAARTAGIPVDRTIIIVYIVTGVTASISGLIRASQLMQGSAVLGDGFELDAITATILGGTSLAGGKGNIWGTFIGAILLAMIRNGLNMIGLSDEYQRLTIGLILLAVLAISGLQELREEKSA
ncbi:MAG: ABC transporter permease [Clostridiales Family XIII bacterium]|jgi:ribose/xylose/arabinose/galactoside ABC-type transport system permease subunit|nr:ABC transporter permease [Clostridiales Family XIII bacterium]